MIEDECGLHYLRPETAQGIFLNFANVVTSARRKPPFGIAQIGKSFRNEITPGNFIFRTREFEQMEMEFFVKPGEDEEWHQYWIDERTRWYTDLGINPDNLRHYEHPQEKLSHYSKRTVDIEYRFNFAGSEWGELEGVANRTDFDLSTHAKHSGHDLSYFDQAADERYVPYVIEPAAGLSRSLMTFLVDAWTEDEAPNTKGGVDKRTVLRLDPRLAPVKVAVLPLSRNEALTPKAQDLAAELRRLLERRVRRLRRDRPPLPPPGRDRHAVLRDRRLRHPRGRRGHGARARHDGAGADLARRAAHLARRAPPRLLSAPMRHARSVTRRAQCPRDPTPPRPQGRARSACCVPALLLAGCGGKRRQKSAPDRSPRSPCPPATSRCPTGVDADQGRHRAEVRQTATVAYEPNAKRSTVLRLTVDSVQQGRIADLAAYQLDAGHEGSRPYYVQCPGEERRHGRRQPHRRPAVRGGRSATR